jgi:multiple sugar transport system permease protein
VTRTGADRWGRLSGVALNGLLIAAAVVMFAPVYWVVVTSVLPPRSIFSLPPVWFPTQISLDYYPAVFGLIPFARQALNSLIVATTVTLGALTTSALAAYAFARLRFPGRDFLFVAFLAALMVPQQVTVIPTFILMRTLGLLDTLPSLILPGLVNVLGIFLLRQFFANVPRSLEDAAKLDGANHLRILVEIILPLSGSALAALGIYVFQLYWNDFFWPNIFLKSVEKMTLPVGLVALQGLYGNAPVAAIFAAMTMVLLPTLIVFVFMQRTLTESIALTGLRG